ncbi:MULTISPECIES: helix-turn-helix domain-containing protein [Kitasatospora]|uniref:Helix-turn-helix domain-containing protein n=1 Tax=Kitasatospora cystarginea TaxID=58350 RepID=A0ABP5Q6Y1_9ACTN
MNEPEPRTHRVIDAKSLRGLAHPLRVHILEALRLDGPATSARLAERLGESTGTISWHLRHLAEHGFIEEELGRGTKRERWWRAVRMQNVLNTADFRHDPALQGTLAVYVQELLRQQFQRASEASAIAWTDDWLGAGSISDWNTLRLTSEQLRALIRDLFEVIERHTPAPDAEPDPDAKPIVLQIQALPRKEAETE